jgi:tetratricopeptide (TPR) repeat protein
VLAFLEHEFGQTALRGRDYPAAARRFNEAIERDPRNVPAHLSLGDLRLLEGRTADAIAAWERLLESSPERAYLAFPRLESAYASLGAPDRFPALCQKLIVANPQDWRARLALARHTAGQGRHDDALALLFDALVVNPHSLALHQAIWETLSALNLPPALVARYVALTRDAVFYLESARLPALPLPLDRAPLAVPALPRVEHVRRRADRSRQRERRRLIHGADTGSSGAAADAPIDGSPRGQPSGGCYRFACIAR